MKMRPSLHRAQMRYSYEWVVGNVNFYPDINRAFIRRNQIECPSKCTALEVEVKKETVSEFTGKYDKKGNKIFENHICRFYGDEGEFADYVIRWDEKSVALSPASCVGTSRYTMILMISFVSGQKL